MPRIARPRTAEPSAPAGKPDQSQSLDNNLKIQNEFNQNRQLDRLQNRYQEKPQGVNPF